VKRQSALVEPVYGYTADDVNPGSGREDLLHRNRAAVDASVRYDWTDAVGDLRGYFGEVRPALRRRRGRGRGRGQGDLLDPEREPPGPRGRTGNPVTRLEVPVTQGGLPCL
jgi:hypothetical protein